MKSMQIDESLLTLRLENAILALYEKAYLFPRAMSQAAALGRIFGECREGQMGLGCQSAVGTLIQMVYCFSWKDGNLPANYFACRYNRNRN